MSFSYVKTFNKNEQYKVLLYLVISVTVIKWWRLTFGNDKTDLFDQGKKQNVLKKDWKPSADFLLKEQ